MTEDQRRVNAAECPACGSYVTPAVDISCWRCGESFIGEHYWDHLYG
jgi:uncharacterized OB-fold protein